MSTAREAGHMGWQFKTSISDVNDVKGYRDGTAETARGSLKELYQWFYNNATLPAGGNKTTNFKLSELRGAAVTRMYVTTSPETTSTYQDSNNGSITVQLDDKTINYELTSGIHVNPPNTNSTKNYLFSKDNGSNWISKSTNSHTFPSLNSGNYNVRGQDGSKAGVFNGTSVYVNATVPYGGNGNNYGWRHR